MPNQPWYEEAKSLGAHPIHTERVIDDQLELLEEAPYAIGSSDFDDDVLPDDPEPKKNDTRSMSDISREELNAKLEATNARVDARLASFESTVRETLSAIRQDSADMRGELKAIHVELSYLKNLKSSIWSAAGLTIASVIAGVGVIIGTLAYGVSTFDSGRETSALIQEAKQQTNETRQLLEQIRAERMAPPASSTPPAAQPKPKS